MAAVLVHIDLDGGEPHPSSLAALAAGRLVASSWGAALYAALIVHDGREQGSADSTAQVMHTQLPAVALTRARLARAGADKVIVAMSDVPVVPLWSALGAAWQAVLDHLRPRLVLFGADAPAAAELGPRTGARIGARLLLRARPITGNIVELRDRDGGYARAQDGGAAVALVGSAPRLPAVLPTRGHDPIELVMIAVPGGGDPRIQLVGSGPAETVHTCGTVIAIGDDVATDPAVLADARRLAAGLGGVVVGGAGAEALARNAAIAPELCVQIGAVALDLAGASCVIRLGGPKRAETVPGSALGALPSPTSVDGAIAGAPGAALAELVDRLELP